MCCERCQHLGNNYQIGSPDDLRHAIAIASINLTNGTLQLVELPNRYSSSTPFAEVAAGAAWDDIVGYYFQCTTCQQCFLLGAETYHGRGGSWGPYFESTEDAR